ncbi:MAG: RDD family protein, partial [Candidatus Eisenbacteria bacterium]|nr:RDD family protein [Candidatus Eisenbacteria bacterium]
VATVLLLSAADAGAGVWIFTIFALFFLRNFYFIMSELHFAGRTLGKRIFGLRVVTTDGGPLTADLVFARNLTRELEFLLPLGLAISGTTVGAMPSIVVRIAAIAWLVAMVVIPLRNSHRARLGDLVAGTMVVVAPKVTLLADLVEASGTTKAARPRLLFTPEQLAFYGIDELQVLEDVLRRPVGEVDYRLLDKLAAKIQEKIGWTPSGERVHSLEFLEAFYAAQRAALEKELAFGRRRHRKRK